MPGESHITLGEIAQIGGVLLPHAFDQLLGRDAFALGAQHDRGAVGVVRPVLEVAGVQDILTKCIGTSNPHNVIHATIDALQQLRSADISAGLRGKRVEEIRE